MEANTGDDNHLDSNVLLPPRKRLLAGMKKQNGDSKGSSYPPSTSMSMYDFDTRLNNLLSAHLSDNNHSPEEIVAAARSAAEAAVKIAKAARVAAQKKEVKASMAMAAAKKALDLVAAIDEQETSSCVEQQSKKNKTMTEVVEDGKTSDEGLALHLHQATNSSARISKYDSPADLKEVPIISENGSIVNGSIVVEENSALARNRSKLIRYNVDKNGTKIMEKEKHFCEEDPSSLGRKRGKMKQTKLPLSIRGDRDQLNPQKNCRRKSTELVHENKGDKTMFSVRPSAIGITPVERNSLWKCKSFKSAARLEQNKGYHDVPIAYHNNLQLQ